jgi:hypothetical protein
LFGEAVVFRKDIHLHSLIESFAYCEKTDNACFSIPYESSIIKQSYSFRKSVYFLPKQAFKRLLLSAEMVWQSKKVVDLS